MRKAILLLFFLPVMGFAQDITNTLGANGSFGVEDNSNQILISANRTGTNSADIIFLGDYSSSFNLPTYDASQLGSVIFSQNNAKSRIDLISSGSNNFSFLNFLYTPGFLDNPGDISSGNRLGLIQFGGYFGSWRAGAATFEVVVSGTPSGIADIPTEMRFTNNAAGTPKTMTFDNIGQLSIPNLAGSGQGVVLASPTGTLTRSGSLPSSISLSNPQVFGLASGGATGTDIQYNLGTGRFIRVSSDGRLKKNITPITWGLDEIIQLKPVTYQWKEESDDAEKTYGFIAQDLYPIFPEMVPIGEDGYHGYRADYLIPVLVKAIQEQQDIIKQLQEENSFLSANSTSQEDRLSQLEQRLQDLENLIAPVKAEK